MIAAIKKVHDGIGTLTSTARKYNVPRRTLDDRAKGKVVHGTKATHRIFSSTLQVTDSAFI